MSTYTLSGTGIQAISAGVGALHVSILSPPSSSGNGLANPPDFYGVAYLRFGDATGFWEPYPVCGGPQWMPVPTGCTRIGYAVVGSGSISVAEVIGPGPFAQALAGLTDVSLSSLADAQVLTYQASSARWINTTPTSGGGGGSGSNGALIGTPTVLTASAANFDFSSIPSTYTVLVISGAYRTDQSSQTVCSMQLNGDTTLSHYLSGSGGSGSNRLFVVASSNYTSALYTGWTLWLPRYATTDASHYVHMMQVGRPDGTASDNNGLIWTPATPAAINHVRIQPNAGNFVTGSWAMVQGY